MISAYHHFCLLLITCNRLEICLRQYESVTIKACLRHYKSENCHLVLALIKLTSSHKCTLEHERFFNEGLLESNENEAWNHLNIFHFFILQVNGELVLLPYVHPMETMMIYRAPGNATVVESRGLLHVHYTHQGFLNISLSTLFYNVTCGLCGVFNSNATDDLRLPNGRQAESIEQFTDGWRSIADDLTCNGDCDDLYRMCTDLRLYQSPWMCGNINDPGNSSFLACHAVVNPSPFFRNCLYNMCVREGNRSALCSSLQAYATACQDAQVGLASWRSTTNCRE